MMGNYGVELVGRGLYDLFEGNLLIAALLVLTLTYLVGAIAIFIYLLAARRHSRTSLMSSLWFALIIGYLAIWPYSGKAGNLNGEDAAMFLLLCVGFVLNIRSLGYDRPKAKLQ